MEEEHKKKGKRKVIIGVVVAVLAAAAIAGLVAGLVTRGSDEEEPERPTPGEREFSRIDCYPEAQGAAVQLDQQRCQARGCTYDPFWDPKVPDCFMPGDDYGFTVSGEAENTTLGQRWVLQPKGPGIFESQVAEISFSVEMRGDYLLRFTFDDANATANRYKVPLELTLGELKAPNPRYRVEVYQHDPFAFRVVRTSSGVVLWDTGVGGLTFSDRFLQISTRLPSHNVYGFGENIHQSFRHDLNFRTWGMFARDQPTGPLEHNLYGVHPFYECVENDGNTHGVFLLNSNAMDYSFTQLPMLTYRTIGGILDFYMFLGPSPEKVIQQYTQMIGLPYMPPYWSLGFQLSRYGYKNTTDMRKALERTLEYNIPIDVQYADIDYMDHQRIFTLDEVNFKDLPQYFAELRERGMSPIVILDPCIEINDTYPAYTRMKEVEAFIKWPSRDVMPDGDYEEYNNTDMMGYVWPEWKVVFPDFFYNETIRVWGELLDDLRDLIPFDGLWIDMNEVANFDTNNEKPWNWPPDREPYWSLHCTESYWDDPPYRTKAAFYFDWEDREIRISDKTICMQGEHMDGQIEYNVHSLYGHQQSVITLPALRATLANHSDTPVRSMLVTRSTYPGTGRYAGRWLGDNDATWLDLRLSIIGMLEFNLFGIPYIGADICGFFNYPSAELCMRWQQLGAFYPFSRNHNHENPQHQDPGFYGDSVAIATRESLEVRYTLLPYLYTLFHHAHTRGSTVIRPVMHEFHRTESTYDIDEQFLWGPALLISPILYKGQRRLDILVPPGRWYDYYSGEAVGGGEEGVVITKTVEYTTPIPLHLRGGYILPTQETANNTHFSRVKPFGLKVALDVYDGQARGDLFWDDGNSIDTYQSGDYYYAAYDCSNNRLRAQVQHQGYNVTGLELDTIEINGITEFLVAYINDLAVPTGDADYNRETHRLMLSNLNIPMDQDFEVEWRTTRRPTPQQALRLNCCPGYSECGVEICMARGCLLGDVFNKPGVPYCYVDNDRYGYNVTNVDETPPGQGAQYILAKRDENASMFGGDFAEVSVDVTFHGQIARIKMTDNTEDRFEVPMHLNLPAGDDSAWDLVVPGVGEQFFLQLNRTGGDPVWDTREVGGLVLADQFLQVATQLNCTNVYGFGEHEHPSLRHRFDYKVWPMFTRDQPPREGANLYGVHPFYLCVEDNGGAHGVLILNSHASEVEFTPYPSLIYRTVGGLLDMYFILGNSPDDVIRQYTQMIGLPYMPPYWSLGFQLSRYGYNNMEDLQGAVNRTRHYQIPYDVQHLDIDVLNKTMDFTYDDVNFPELPNYLEELHTYNIRSYVILDPFLIRNDSWYQPYKDGEAADVYIRWAEGDSPDLDIYNNTVLLGWAWPPGRVVFPDFFLPRTQQFWKDQIIKYRDLLPVDGIWVDMNDPANFGTNEERAWNWPEQDRPYWTLKCPNSTWDDPPFLPSLLVESELGPRISEKTICMAALQSDNVTMYRHYDLHNMYGWSQAQPTVEGMEEATGQRASVVSRSTFPGSGHYTGHWLGDNASIWPHLKKSIIGILEFNFFGIPNVGADICGYFDDCPAEMCQRWMQLGAFYTFSRNHNGFGYTEQDPGAYGDSVAEASRRVLETRYTLLPYLYTLFYQASQTGSAVIRPLFYEFPSDRHTWDVDEQFLWGPALLISPVLQPNTEEVTAYFPDGRWFDYYTGMAVVKSGQNHIVEAPYDSIPLHVRGGHILPTQEPDVATDLSRMKPMGLVVAPDENEEAQGSLYWDDGVSILTPGNYSEYEFSYIPGSLKMTVLQGGEYLDGILVETIRIFGVDRRPENVDHGEFMYDSTSHVLLLTHVGLNFTTDWEITIS